MRALKLLRYFSAIAVSCVSLSCGSERKFDNPVETTDTPQEEQGPDGAKVNTNRTAGTTPGPGTPDESTNPQGVATGPTMSTVKTDGKTTSTQTCLTDNCTPPALAVASGSFSLIDYFPGNQVGVCYVADSTVIKNKSANRMTVIFRAKYASVGKWQLYARNITVAANGSLSQGEPVNLFPNCAGDESGVTGYNILGYASPNFTAQNIALNHLVDSDFTHIKIASLCFSAGPDEQKTFNLATLANDTSTTTTNFLATSGAVGHWPEKNVYIKSDGSSLNPDGSAGNVNISGVGTNLKILGSDADKLYFMPQDGNNNPSYYITLSNYNKQSINNGSYGKYNGIGKHIKLGFFYFYDSSKLYNFSNNLETSFGYAPGSLVDGASRILGYKGFLIGTTNCQVKKINFTEKTFTSIFSANANCTLSLGTWGNQSVLTNVTSTATSIGKLFLTSDLSEL